MRDTHPSRRSLARRLRVGAAVLLAGWLGVPGPAAASDDPGLVIELDRGGYTARVWDERSGELGPSFAIALGSPSHPTPTGRFPVSWVILEPSWTPSPEALAAGARPEPSSVETPMGVAKIPFAEGGSIALHGAGDPRLLGQPVSGGCVRAGDGDLLRLLAWLDLRGALGEPRVHGDGEVHRPFHRPARIVVR